jgi:hypothetical protein
MQTSEELRRFFSSPPQANNPPPDELAMAIVEAFRVADEAGRRKIATKLGPEAQCAFLSLASRMAVLSVRRNAPELIVVGLCALAVEGGGSDIRDAIVALAKLYHSAIKLGMNAFDTFSSAASLATSDRLCHEMARFPHRHPVDRDLAAFFLREDLTGGEFNYTQVVA